MTATLTESFAETRTTDEPGDAAHIVRIPRELEGRTTPQAYVLAARVEGAPVTAECGRVWVPQRDPGPLPVCARCLEVYRWRCADDDGSTPSA